MIYSEKGVTISHRDSRTPRYQALFYVSFILLEGRAMFNRILPPMESSKLTECVLPHLVALEKIFEQDVQLLRVLEPFGVTAAHADD